MVALALLGLSACTQVYYDPGPNPAKIQVKIWAKVPQRLKNFPTEVISWDWGLHLVVANRPDPMLPPTVKQDFYMIPKTNPLVRDTTFLAPPGRHTYLLVAYGYAIRQQGDSSGPVVLTKMEENLTLDLKPGQHYLIERRVGGD